ncbi:MAG: hypothetical protein LUQ09_01300 [Methanomassiliicoccales archaeon]|nr:hypothetical protein [Methanomassiliicoccales archaeon]
MRRLACMLLAIAMLATAGMAITDTASAAEPAPEWQYWGDMSHPFYLAASVQDDDYNLYVMGGRLNTVNDAYDTVSVIDMNTMMETSLASMPIGSAGGCAAMGEDGRIYVFGGKNLSTDIAFIAPVQIYDPVADAWTTGANMTVPMTIANTVAMPNGLIYVLGGMNTSTPTTITNLVQIYDPTADSWSAGEPIPGVRYAGMTFAMGSRYIVYAGGSDSSISTSFDTIFVYDTFADVWTTSTDILPDDMAACGTFVGPDCLLYMTGGGRGDNAYGTNTNFVSGCIAYDPFSGNIIDLPNMVSPRKYHATGYDDEGNLYVFGGYSTGFVSSAGIEVLHIADASTVHLGPSEDVESGDEIVVSVDLNFAIAEYAVLEADFQLIDAGASIEASGHIEAYDVGEQPAHFYIEVPEGLETGAYTVRLFNVHSYGDDIEGFYLEEVQEPLNVTHVYSLQDQLDEQNGVIDDLQDQLNAANGTIDDQQDQIDGLQENLDGKMDGGMGMMLIVLALIAVFLGAVALVLVLRKKA